jgi:hypothetical protein
VLDKIEAWHQRQFRQAARVALRRVSAGLRDLRDNLDAAAGILLEHRESSTWSSWGREGSALWANLDDLHALAKDRQDEARRLVERLTVERLTPAAPTFSSMPSPHFRRAALEVLRDVCPDVARSDTLLAYWEIARGFAAPLRTGNKAREEFARRVARWKAARRAS